MRDLLLPVALIRTYMYDYGKSHPQNHSTFPRDVCAAAPEIILGVNKEKAPQEVIKGGFLIVLDFIAATADSLSHKNLTFFLFAHSLTKTAAATIIGISSFTAMDKSTSAPSDRKLASARSVKIS